MPSERLESFNFMVSHPWLKKAFGRLSKEEREIAINFILNNDSKPKGEFELLVNRMFMDKEKPKNWIIITEVLTNVNSSLGKQKS